MGLITQTCMARSSKTLMKAKYIMKTMQKELHNFRGFSVYFFNTVDECKIHLLKVIYLILCTRNYWKKMNYWKGKLWDSMQIWNPNECQVIEIMTKTVIGKTDKYKNMKYWKPGRPIALS